MTSETKERRSRIARGHAKDPGTAAQPAPGGKSKSPSGTTGRGKGAGKDPTPSEVATPAAPPTVPPSTSGTRPARSPRAAAGSEDGPPQPSTTGGRRTARTGAHRTDETTSSAEITGARAQPKPTASPAAAHQATDTSGETAALQPATEHAGEGEGEAPSTPAPATGLTSDAAAATSAEAETVSEAVGATIEAAATTDVTAAATSTEEGPLAAADAQGPNSRQGTAETGLGGPALRVVASTSPAPGDSLLSCQSSAVLDATVRVGVLQDVLPLVNSALPSKTTLPVLSNVQVTVSGGSLSLTATDLDTTVTRTIPVENAASGTVLVDGRKLGEIARELPKDADVRFQMSGERISLRCAATRTCYKLGATPGSEFPSPPRVNWIQGRIASIPGTTFRLLTARTAFAASTEETRPILNGVLFRIARGELLMVATNGHRLVETRARADLLGAATDPLAAEAGGEPGEAAGTELIVHPGALAVVCKLAGEGDVEIARTRNHVGFRGAGWEVITRQIEGPYPNYGVVIPRDNDKVAILDKTTLRGALRRMAILASDQTHRVRVSLSGSSLFLGVESPDLGSASEEVAVDYTGDPLVIGFNATYFLELLSHLPDSDLRIMLKGPERAATLHPVEDESGIESTSVLMPLRLAS